MALHVTLNGAHHRVEIVRRRPNLVLRIDGQEHELTRIGDEGDGRQTISFASGNVHFTRATLGDLQIVRLGGRTLNIGIVDPLANSEEAAARHDMLRAPMPGAVVNVHHEVGGAVKRGQTIVTIESMKLQTGLPSPRDGTIAEILRAEGQTFEKDEVLVLLAPLLEEA